jgi:hypothetical protein
MLLPPVDPGLSPKWVMTTETALDNGEMSVCSPQVFKASLSDGN